jgi:hypothetical protein
VPLFPARYPFTSDDPNSPTKGQRIKEEILYLKRWYSTIHIFLGSCLTKAPIDPLGIEKPEQYNGFKETHPMRPASHQALLRQSDALYERYGKPLEKTHRGKYVAISQAGKTLIADTLFDLMQQAKTTLGPGNFIFKVGERAVGKWL